MQLFFHKCEKLISVIIPEGVTDIGSYSFSGCTKLRKIEIPKSVSSISYKSFLNCKELINIKIPDSVTNIDSHSFDNTPWLAKKQKENPLVIVNGFLIDGKTAEGDIIIPEEVKHICDCCFLKCQNLISVFIPEGIVDIGIEVFRDCTKLRKIIIPESVSRIGDRAFWNCKELININIPDTVKIIGSRIFYGCEKLPKNILSKFSDKISNDNPKMPNKVNSTEIQQLSQNNYLTTKQKNNHNSISKLNNLVGLSAIKSDVIGLVNLIKIQNKRKDMGMKSVPISLHLVFSGNPGTGKTTVARILADIYKDIGILSKGHLVEVDRSGLVAGFVGQTALKTQEKINEAIGGILFIDEAYTLVKGGQDFGQEAVDTILKAMEDHREDFIVIVAGYSNLMHNFINSNPGLKSRFNKYINFPDYSADELIEIFYSMCNEYQYKLSTNADKTMREKIVLLEANKTKNFANARDVRNIFEKVITNQATRLAMSNSTDDIMEITEEDF